MGWTIPATGAKGGGGTEKAPAGNHLARLVGLFRMGTQLDDFDPQNEKWQRKVYLVWELLGVKVSGQDRCHVIGAAVTESLNEKATWRKWIQARTGKPIPDGTDFDPLTELDQPCMLNVIEKNGYPRVEGVAAVPAAFLASCPKATYPVTALTDLNEFASGAFKIPEWVPWLYGSELADHIKASKELGGSKPRPKKGDGPAGQPKKEDQIPF